MLNFSDITLDEFLKNYWQKKPFVIRNAINGFENSLTADDLAGLSLEEEAESRLVFETPEKAPYWALKRGPFTEEDFKTLPESHWTLLVQGVDRFVPEVAALLDHFNFIPSWRVDDVMISYAVEMGSVGPHYDNYDVFLYQAKGRRKWLLTTQDCVDNNFHLDVDLRIMKEFKVEQEFILEEGDMLYLPPHVGHHGISLSSNCMTYSFGYRSYQGQELWDSLGEYMASQEYPTEYYRDPVWSTTSGTSEIPREAWVQAKTAMQSILDDEDLFKNWFAAFATTLDRHAELLLPEPPEEEDCVSLHNFIEQLTDSVGLVQNPVCRFAYVTDQQKLALSLHINGYEWDINQVDKELVKLVADNRSLLINTVMPFMNILANQTFLYELWKLQWIECMED